MGNRDRQCFLKHLHHVMHETVRTRHTSAHGHTCPGLKAKSPFVSPRVPSPPSHSRLTATALNRQALPPHHASIQTKR
eukprot:3879667-Rhodomonas_salina.5